MGSVSCRETRDQGTQTILATPEEDATRNYKRSKHTTNLLVAIVQSNIILCILLEIQELEERLTIETKKKQKLEDECRAWQKRDDERKQREKTTDRRKRRERETDRRRKEEMDERRTRDLERELTEMRKMVEQWKKHEDEALGREKQRAQENKRIAALKERIWIEETEREKIRRGM